MTKTDEDGGQPQSTEQVYAHVRNAILDGEFVGLGDVSGLAG